MQSLIICTCGCKEFKKENNMIVCSDCGKKPENSEKAGFLAPTDEKSIIALTKLGINIGAEAANVGAGVLIGIVAPWSLPFTLTALGVTIQHGADALSNMIEDKFYSPGSYGEQISSIFEKVLNNALKRGKKGDEKYASFYNYHVFCSKDYLEIVSKLIDKDVSIDIYSDEAIRTIISDEFMYPGREDAELLNKILRTAKEVRSNFENKVIEDKNLGFRWLIEKISSEHNEKLEKVITLLGSQDTDNQIDDDTYEYIKNYQRPLFLDINTGITLGKMYLDSIVVNHNEKDNVKAIDVVMDWVNGYSNEKLLMVFGAAGVGKTSFITKIISDICSVSGNENAFNLTKDKVHPIILRNNISEIEDMTKNEAYSALKAIIKILDLSVSQLAGHLIILDGFDELCVLSTSFKGESFLKKLYNDLKSQNIKILITSRPMEELKISNANIPFINIEWTEKQVSDWCDKFSELTDSNEEKQ